MIVTLSLSPPTFRPVTIMPHAIEHAIIFLITGTVFALAYRIRLIFFLASAVCFSGCLEVLQSFAPGRHARLSDFFVDAIGACVGVIFASAKFWLQKRSINS